MIFGICSAFSFPIIPRLALAELEEPDPLHAQPQIMPIKSSALSERTVQGKREIDKGNIGAQAIFERSQPREESWYVHTPIHLGTHLRRSNLGNDDS